MTWSLDGVAAFCWFLIFLNGLRAVFGIAPLSYWFRSKRCVRCEGVGFVKDDAADARIGVIDEYGSIWDGEPGASKRIGETQIRADEETYDLYLGEWE